MMDGRMGYITVSLYATFMNICHVEYMCYPDLKYLSLMIICSQAIRIWVQSKWNEFLTW